MKVILAILIWVIIALVIILGVKTIIKKIQELKEKKQVDNKIKEEEKRKE